MTLEVSVQRDEAYFALPGWRDLVAADPQAHVFSTPEWHRVWWDELGTGKELVVLTIEDGDRLVGIVPLYRKVEEGRKILRFVGGIDLTDYIGPVCAPEDREAVARATVEWLGRTDVEWDELDAHNLPVPHGFGEFLVDHADRAGFSFRVDQEETAAILCLPADWDGYLLTLGSKQRHELKRKRRRLEREYPDARVRAVTAETLDIDMKTFVEMHRGAGGPKSRFMNRDVAAFFERVAACFMPRGWLRLDFLEVEGRAMAATFGFEFGNTFYLYNSAYEPDFRRLSPGFVLVSSLVRASMERGLSAFDFLRGPERYKYELGSETVPLNRVRIVRDPAGTRDTVGGSP